MLEAGTALADITPPDGSLMACFPRWPNREPRRAQGAHDRLQARALVLRDQHDTAAIVCCDLCGVRKIDIERIRTRVTDAVPALSGGRVILACSHSHSSVENLYLFGNTPDDPFVQDMDKRIADAVIEAYANTEPVTAAFGTAPVALNHNRRVLDSDGHATSAWQYREGVTTGTVDPELAVLSFVAKTGQTKAVLFRYTAHSLTLGKDNDLYTADYPGRAREEIETAFPGSMALFLNGAAGNVHPHECLRSDFSAMDTMGSALGKAAAKRAGSAAPICVPELRFACDTLTFPNRVDPSLEVSVELSCLALGPVVLGFVPGEVFVEFQLAFRANVAPAHGVFVGYTNGWPGYIPTRAAYPEGGYGVDLCTSDPPEYSRTALPPGAGETMTERLCEMANGLIAAQ